MRQAGDPSPEAGIDPGAGQLGRDVGDGVAIGLAIGLVEVVPGEGRAVLRVVALLGRQRGAVGFAERPGGGVGGIGQELAGGEDRGQVAERDQRVEAAVRLAGRGDGVQLAHPNEDRRRVEVDRAQQRLQRRRRRQRLDVGGQADIGRGDRTGVGDGLGDHLRVRVHGPAADFALDEQRLGAGVDLRRSHPQYALQRLGLRVDHRQSGQLEIGGAAVDDQVAGDRLAGLAEADDQGVDARLVTVLGDQERRVGNGQAPGGDGRLRQHPGARLVEGGAGVLGQAHVAHQHGDVRLGRRQSGGPGQGQRFGVVLVRHQDVVGASGIVDHRLRPLLRRPGQGDDPEGRRIERRGAQPERGAALPLGGLEGGGGQGVAADDHHRLLQPPRHRGRQALLQQAAYRHQGGGEQHDHPGPAGDADVPVAERRTLVIGVVGVVDQADGFIEGVVEIDPAAHPAPDAEHDGDRRQDRDRPDRANRDRPFALLHRLVRPPRPIPTD